MSKNQMDGPEEWHIRLTSRLSVHIPSIHTEVFLPDVLESILSPAKLMRDGFVLKSTSTLAEDPGLVPSIHIVILVPKMPSSDPCGHQIHTRCTCMYAHGAEHQTHEIKSFQKLRNELVSRKSLIYYS